ncbi:MAG: VOC family protein [Pseudomonadota bacterium]
MTELEHVNVTVADAEATAKMLCDLFGWRVRWSGPARDNGYTFHVGSDTSYVAVYSLPEGQTPPRGPDRLNHIGVVVDDLDAAEAKVKALGYDTHSHGDYEPGRRFYFDEENGIEIEVVSYR